MKKTGRIKTVKHTTDKEIKMRKQIFYEKMQPYFNQGLVREIYSSDHVAILSVGEIVYVACSYILLANEPCGIFVNGNVMKKIVKKNRYIYPLIQRVFSDVEENQNLIFDFSYDNIGFWKKWFGENQNVNKIDPKLEEEIQRMAASLQR